MLETIGFSELIDADQLSSALKQLFPELEFQQIELAEPENLPHGMKNIVYFVPILTESDFPLRIELYNLPSDNTNEREQYIGQRMAQLVKCRTIVDYQGPGYEYSPFHNLVFDGPKVFLATSQESAYMEEGTSNIQLVEELSEFHTLEFDSEGLKK
jgi:hypothetical protein